MRDQIQAYKAQNGI
ncbi:MAG: hypothetical protein ACLRZN_08080 [Dialister invisus]